MERTRDGLAQCRVHIGGDRGKKAGANIGSAGLKRCTFGVFFFRKFPTLSATKKMGGTSFFPAIEKCLILNLKAIRKCF